jgi:hypothetical protein
MIYCAASNYLAMRPPITCKTPGAMFQFLGGLCGGASACKVGWRGVGASCRRYSVRAHLAGQNSYRYITKSHGSQGRKSNAPKSCSSINAATKHSSFPCGAVCLRAPKVIVIVPSHRIRRRQPNKFRKCQPKPKHFKAKNIVQASNRIS